MNVHDQSKKLADKSAAIAHEFANAVSATVENMRNYHSKMIDMTQVNIAAVFEFAGQLATAKSPSDVMELWTSHARKQYEMLSEQLSELTALGQKMASESADPIARCVGQVFMKAS